MTPFELWRAGRGEEPVVVAEMPVRQAGPFSAMRAPWFWIGIACSPGFRMFTPSPDGPEEQAAAEECRAALAAALARDDRLAVARIINAEINLVAETMDHYKAGTDGWNSAADRLATLETLRQAIADSIGWPTTEELCAP